MRKQEELFQKYQHNQELVKFINLYAPEDANELGPGWERQQDEKQRTFYVNHQEHFTTYFNPCAVDALKESDQRVISNDLNGESEVVETEPAETQPSRPSSVALSYPDQESVFEKNEKIAWYKNYLYGI